MGPSAERKTRCASCPASAALVIPFQALRGNRLGGDFERQGQCECQAFEVLHFELARDGRFLGEIENQQPDGARRRLERKHQDRERIA